jgi:hypothetical protein
VKEIIEDEEATNLCYNQVVFIEEGEDYDRFIVLSDIIFQSQLVINIREYINGG